MSNKLMKHKFSLFMLVLMINTSVFSDVTIQTPEQIRIEKINGKDVKGFFTKKDVYSLNAGVNTIDVRYVDYYEENKNIGSHDIIRSDTFIFKTPNLEDNKVYVLKLDNVPHSYDQAKKVAKEPKFRLYDKQRELPLEQIGVINPYAGLANQLFNGQVNSSIGLRDEFTNKKSDENLIHNNNDMDLQLIQDWKKATKLERQKFMSWLAEQ